MGQLQGCVQSKSKDGWKGDKARVSQGISQQAQAQELSGQPGVCLPTELRENQFLERVYLNGQAKAVAPHPSELLFGGRRRSWVGEECTVYPGLGPQSLGVFL